MQVICPSCQKSYERKSNSQKLCGSRKILGSCAHNARKEFLRSYSRYYIKNVWRANPENRKKDYERLCLRRDKQRALRPPKVYISKPIVPKVKKEKVAKPRVYREPEIFVIPEIVKFFEDQNARQQEIAAKRKQLLGIT